MRQSISASNQISFDLNNYDSKEEMFSDISSLLDILTKNNYECSFNYEDCGIYILQFDFDNEEYGCSRVYWLNPEQEECLYSSNNIIGDNDEQE